MMDVASATFVLVGSYASPEETGLYAFALNGGINPQAAWTGLRNPSFVAVHPRGPYVYVVSETGLANDGVAGTVHAFRIDRPGGMWNLSALNHQPSSGDHPCHLAMDRDGRWLAASNYGSGSVSVLPIRPDGSLADATAVVHHSGDGPNRERQEGPHTHASVFSPDGRSLIVADLGIDQLIVYEFDPGTGSLTPRLTVEAAPGAGPRHLAFHPDGVHLFVVNELDSTLVLLRWEGSDRQLHRRQTVSTLSGDTRHNTAADIHVSPSGRHVYVSNRGHDSLAVYEFDEVRGLTLTAVRPCGGTVPRGFGLVPDGGEVIVANQGSGELVVLPLIDGGADVGDPLARMPVRQASCVAFLSNVD